MKRKIRLTESQLYRVVKESVRKVIKESKGKQKLKNSFKSKEDMTRYRDMYAPDSITTYVDDYGSAYDNDLNRGYGHWGSGPYKNYCNHIFDDGYDYCGDDQYNEDVYQYNDGLNKRLATKGGQMSYDWDEMKRQHENDIEDQKASLNNLQKAYDMIYHGKHGNLDYWKKQWIENNPKVNDEFWTEYTGNPKQRAEDFILHPTWII